jgi:hypothetical protein
VSAGFLFVTQLRSPSISGVKSAQFGTFSVQKRGEFLCPRAAVAEDQALLAVVQDAQNVCGIRQAADVVNHDVSTGRLGSHWRNHDPAALGRDTYLIQLPSAVKEEQRPDGSTARQCVFTPHSIRATTATLLLDVGIDHVGDRLGRGLDVPLAEAIDHYGEVRIADYHVGAEHSVQLNGNHLFADVLFLHRVTATAAEADGKSGIYDIPGFGVGHCKFVVDLNLPDGSLFSSASPRRDSRSGRTPSRWPYPKVP